MKRTRRKKPPPPLHELEAEVMEQVWKRDRATVREVLEALNRGQKQRAYTTIMTIMSRLHQKGHLTRERSGKTDVYAPMMNRDAYLLARAQAEVHALVEEFGDLALTQFAAQMEKLDPARLRQLRKLARDE